MVDEERFAGPSARVQVGQEAAETAFGPCDSARGGRRANERAVPDARVDPQQGLGKCEVLQRRQRRHAAGGHVRRGRDGKARADERRVARRAVVGLRIDEVFDLGDGAPIRALARIQQARRCEQRSGLVVAENDACRHRVHAGRGAIGLRDPVRGHERVGVGRRDETAGPARRGEPCGGRVHHGLPRRAHVRDGARQVGARDR